MHWTQNLVLGDQSVDSNPSSGIPVTYGKSQEILLYDYVFLLINHIQS